MRMVKITTYCLSKITFFLTVIGGLTSFTSCGEKEVKTIVPPKWSNTQSIALQKELATQEAIDIRLFLAGHRDWKMIQTGTGLQYFIYAGATGKTFAKAGQQVEVAYQIKQLDGTELYSTDENDSRIFTFEKSDVETGIHEIIKQMPVGAKAHVIIPSHLAHGLTGDNNKIPPLTCLVIDLEFISIK
jgi:FKBP-type peptidyl-prolyl cis-trans isomerase